MAILVWGETSKIAEDWCRANGVKPFGRDTYLIRSETAGRGRMLTGEDRIVFVGDVERRHDYVETMVSILPALREDAQVEYVAWA
jgi:hypothetical protein